MYDVEITGGVMLKEYKLEYLAKDIPAGIIVALVSIPISMGYAQVAGLPVVYGLYGSLLPILVFGLITSSPQFVFGIDAAPSALVGGLIAVLGITAGSAKAIEIVPVISMITALWLFLFYLLKAGKFTNLISTPVMGGFISGIGFTIITMQIPKLFGGEVIEGEFFTQIFNIIGQIILYHRFNLLSLCLGIGTILILRIFARFWPKIPMTVIMMIAGAIMAKYLPLASHGVKLLPKVEAGMPDFAMPDFTTVSGNFSHIVLSSFTIAVVIVAETLLATNNFAMKNNYKIKPGRELLAYAIGNVASAVTGCGPVSGSVSRTGIAAQFGAKSQVMSLVASVTMAAVLLFGTGFIAYLPVPVLTGIVISALMSILEFKLARELKKADRSEWIIFYAAFWGVLLFGTIYGVLIGMVLSFVAVAIRAVVPPKAYMGCIPGKDGFYTLKRNRNARPIKNTVIYRFSGSLFFANIGKFQEDIENAAVEGVNQIIVDASGIGSIDITAADRLAMIYKNLNEKGIAFYITEHVGIVNDKLVKLGKGNLIEEGVVKRHIEDALAEAGLTRPYPLETYEDDDERKVKLIDDKLAEFEWAFGENADQKLKKYAYKMALEIAASGKYDPAKERNLKETIAMGHWDAMDEEDLLDYLEMELELIGQKENRDLSNVEEEIENHRYMVIEELTMKNPRAFYLMKERRRRNETDFREKHPELYAVMERRRGLHEERLEKLANMRRLDK